MQGMEKPNLFERINAQNVIERLLLKRNPLDYQAYVETFRESLIDANPHQVEAIVFGLEKLENGGCILADEVGLGKTIEAGLIISQYRAQRRFNILILVPTSLAGQWSNELRKLFQIPSRIVTAKDKKGIKPENMDQLFQQNGVYLMGREFAARLEKSNILSRKQWDLIVVDEAHEVFANIYRRFNPRTGEYKERSKESRTAGNLFRLFKRTPLLLLTATPIQNNIFELWGLSSYILPETNKSHLGKFNHFKELFLQNGEAVEDKLPELKERIGNFLVRNLRVNAQEFMKYTFTDRNCKTLNFNMGNEEKTLYNNISEYFERDDIYAYSTNGLIDLKDNKKGGMRNLLKMSYRRALGSSFFALTSSLESIIERLEKMKNGEWETVIRSTGTDDWENDAEDLIHFDLEEEEIRIPYCPNADDIRAIESEIAMVRSFIDGARKLQVTGKDHVLIDALHKCFAEPDRFYEKAVIFTTYTATQQHLLSVLEANGFKDQVILFSGTLGNSDGEKAVLEEALRVWEEEIGPTVSPAERPEGNILERTALVYYFKTRKKIFISTEAGAKGLNLQFCNVIINYDLPWNPQRIEQRIGRCHRYGQQRDVLVINCINADNETEQRIYNILKDKFSLFKALMGAGDDILGTLSKAYNFEFRINEILNQCRTQEERMIHLEKLESEIDDQTRQLRESKLSKTRSLLDELDPQVQRKLKDIRDKLPESFSRYDADLLDLIRYAAHIRELSFQVVERKEEQVFLEYDGKPYYIGKRDEETIRDYQHMDLKHPLVEEMIRQFREPAAAEAIDVIVDYGPGTRGGEILKPYVGRRGRWDLYRVHFSGFEEEERLYHLVCIADGPDEQGLKQLLPEEVEALRTISFRPDPQPPAAPPVADHVINGLLDEAVKTDSQRIQELQQPRIDKNIHNMEIELKDMEAFLRKEETEILNEIANLDKKINSTYDREIGQSLLEKKKRQQTALSRCRKELLEFQNKFQASFDHKRIDLMGKRFLDTGYKKLFTLNFRIL